jgi:hypothetical protein
MPGPVPPPPIVLLRPIGVFISGILKPLARHPYGVVELHEAAVKLLGHDQAPSLEVFANAIGEENGAIGEAWASHHLFNMMLDLGALLSKRTHGPYLPWMAALIYAATIQNAVTEVVQDHFEELALRDRKIREAATFLDLPTETPSHNALDIMVAQLGLLTGRKPPAPGWFRDDEREWSGCYAAWKGDHYVEEFLTIGDDTDEDERLTGWYLQHNRVTVDETDSILNDVENPLEIIAAIGTTARAINLVQWGVDGDLTFLVCQASRARQKLLDGRDAQARTHLRWFEGVRKLPALDAANPISVAVNEVWVAQGNREGLLVALNALHALVAPAQAQAEVAS